MINFLDLWTKGNYCSKNVAQSLALIITFFVLGNLPLILVFYYNDIEKINKASGIIGFQLLFFLMMLPFRFVLIALAIAIRKIHNASFLDWITQRSRISFRRIGFSFLTWGLVCLILFAVQTLFYPSSVHWNFTAGPFINALLLCICFLPFQVLTEELLFRSFALQGLNTRLKSAPLAILISGIMFGVMHFGNPEIEQYGPFFLLVYISFGVFLSLVTALDGGIEIAFGFHLANNMISGLLITSKEQALQIPALFSSKSGSFDVKSALGFLIGMGGFFMLSYFRYGWKFKSLNQKKS